MKSINQKQSVDAIVNLTPFVASAMRGTFAEFLTGFGRLHAPYAAMLNVANRANRVRFIVWSYRTPIAWLDTEYGWVIPDARYSPTTSKHQSRVNEAVRLSQYPVTRVPAA